MSEKRGSKSIRFIDHYIGLSILCILYLLLSLKGFFCVSRKKDSEAILLVCLGAVGDLVLLSHAAQHELSGKRVYLACSNLNIGAARLYNEFYAGIEPVNLKNIFSVSAIAKKLNVKRVFDSTQWANIGAIQVGIAALLVSGLETTGFFTKSYFRNRAYRDVVPHSDQIHELGNFVNLMACTSKITSNTQLCLVVPELYLSGAYRSTGKILIHMWPSGHRSYLKTWPLAHWEVLIQNLVDRGYELYLSGSEVDMKKTEEFVRTINSNKVFNIAGSFELGELRRFVKDEIEFAISVNTGILHLVASTGVPLIGLHGPTNPTRWGPLGARAFSLLPASGHSAYLNYGFEYPDDDEEAYVLDRLSVSQVVKAVDALLASQ